MGQIRSQPQNNIIGSLYRLWFTTMKNKSLLILPLNNAHNHHQSILVYLKVDVLLSELTQLVVEFLDFSHSCAHLVGRLGLTDKFRQN